MSDRAEDPEHLQQRLDRFDARIRDLERELNELRALLGAREEQSEPQPAPVAKEPPVPIAPLPPITAAPQQTLAEEPAWHLPPLPREQEPAPPRVPPARTTLDIEALLSGRVLAWVGGLAILIGSLFFLSLAFSRGWIGPETRVIIGLIAGAGMVIGGAYFFERRERIFGHILFAVGIGVFNLAIFAATNLYDLISSGIALAGTFAAAAFGAFVAIRARSQVAAVYGLLPALIAPALFDSGTDQGPSGVTIAYLGILLSGTAAISLYRTWTWLPLLSLIFTFFQLFIWLDEQSPHAALGLAIIAGYWLLHALAAGGEDIRTLRNRLRISSTAVATLSTAVAIGAGFLLLDGSLAEWRGLYLIGLAALHIPLAGYLLYRGGDRHPFGMLMTGLGLAVAAIAVPVQFSGEAVPIAWAALAIVMIWLYGRLDNQFSLLAGFAFGGLALWHVVLFDYPLSDFLSRDALSDYPFINGSGAVLGALLLAIAMSAYVSKSRDLTAGAILLGAALIAYALPYELTDGWLIATWSLVALALAAAHRVEPTGHPVFALAGLGLAGFAMLVNLARVATPSRLRVSLFSEVDHFPLWSHATLALASLAIALIAAWFLHRREYPFLTSFVMGAAAALVVYMFSIGLVDEFQKRVDADGANLGAIREQAQVGLSVLWTSFGAASFILGVVLRRTAMRVFGLALLGIAIIKVFIVDLASLDASYRVISFIALGILLLLASYLYQRIMAGESDDANAGTTTNFPAS